ncbi:MAG: aminopeptidase P family N-terminal domain-containing protein, partial [Methylobacteriaceae bacterium]|nr:aminopeptidase P family N-terminal domain-containing protein [Methylobacteriaceae bacterium]
MSTRFQSFDDVASPSHGTERIPLLRAELARRGLDGFVVPRADEHQSEYVPPHAERLAWLTGFTGSAGTAIVLAGQAALLVDGRYVLQAPAQVDTSLLTIVPSGETSPEAWIEANLPAGAALGYDPWLHTKASVKRLSAAAGKAGGRLVPTDGNPIDAVWADRPSPPRAPVTIRAMELAGEDVPAKLGRVRAALAKDGVGALLVSDPHSLAWTFNLRGGDVAHTPLALGYALIPAATDERPILFLDPAKLTNETGDVLGGVADLRPPDALAPALRRLGEARAKVRLDAATAASALADRLGEAGGEADDGPDPIARLKAVKNPVEIAGTREAHRRDGAAFARFLAWLA